MLSVVTPQSTGIGGGGFLLFYEASKEKVSTFDFRERAPLASFETMYQKEGGLDLSFNNSSLNGPLSVGTPGLVAGLWQMHQKFGKLPWSELVKPSIHYAETGFQVDHKLASALEKRSDILASFEESKKIFFKGNKPLALGDLLVQKDLAKTLRLIQENGQDGFYKGSVAKGIVDSCSDRGILTQEDLDSYTVKKRDAIRSKYKAFTLVSMPPPSSGGVHIAQILNMLEDDKLSSYDPYDPERIHLVAESMRRAYRDRASYLGDPDFYPVPRKKLLSKKYAKELRKSIDLKKAFHIQPRDESSLYEESQSTTHFSIVDREGNAVSSTQTINYAFGSCLVAKGTGVLLNDEMDDFARAPGVPNAYGLVGSKANMVEPGKTMLSSMSPSFLFSESGDLRLVLGAPGGSRIITATLQTILNVIEHKMPLQEAVNFPRFHHQWLPNKLLIEKKDFSKNCLEILESKGHKLKDPSYTMGNVQGVEVKENGILVGASDKRGIGEARGF